MDFFTGKLWHHLSSTETLETFETNPDKGLDRFQVPRRTAEFGPNALTARKGKTRLERLLLQFHQPLIYILIVSAVIAAALGEVVDASVIMGVVLINAIVGYIQEAKAAGALEALPRSMVTEAAKEAADMILTDDNFAAIEGRDSGHGPHSAHPAGRRHPAAGRGRDHGYGRSGLSGSGIRKEHAHAEIVISFGMEAGFPVFFIAGTR